MARQPRKQCDQCYYWHKGYHVQGMKVPSFCTRHHHSQLGNDPACPEYADKEDEPSW